MEGSYLPGYYRAKIVNEVRSTHFEMGRNQFGFATTNSQKFKGLPGARDASFNTGNVSHVACLMEGKAEVSTESVSKYRSYTEEPRVKPLKRESNLEVGKGVGTYVTTVKEMMKKHDVQEVRSGEDRVRNMRKHNFEIGTGEKIEYRTEVMRKIKNDGGKNVLATDKEIKGRYEKSPEFGEKSGVFVPTSHQDYKKFKPDSFPMKKPSDATNIPFLDPKQDLSTTSQSSYIAQKLESSSLPKHTLKDLKSSHLNLGSIPVSYTLSSNQSSPVSNPIKPTRASGSPSSLNFGHSPPKYKTDYSLNYAQRAKSELRVKFQKKHENYSNVILGDETEKMTTQALSSFKAHREAPGSLPREIERSLKTHHFKLGIDSNSFTPTSNDFKIPTVEISSSPIAKESKALMLESHWNFGSVPGKVQSSVQHEYQWRGSPTRQHLNTSELRQSHFRIGQDKSTWNSNYKTHFNWIQPVPDTNYKIALMNSPKIKT